MRRHSFIIVLSGTDPGVLSSRMVRKSFAPSFIFETEMTNRFVESFLDAITSINSCFSLQGFLNRLSVQKWPEIPVFVSCRQSLLFKSYHGPHPTSPTFVVGPVRD